MQEKRNRIVIIGGVAAGPKAAARARRCDPHADITIIESGKILSYAGCGMPFCIGGDMEDCSKLDCSAGGVPRDVAFFRDVKNVTVYNGTLAERINRQAKTVDVVSLETSERRTIPYDKLVLATGGTHFIPPVPGIKLNRVYHLGHPDDATAIREAVVSGAVKSVVIMGAGLIGMEMVEAFAKRGVKVTLVEMLPHVLPKLLDPETAMLVSDYLRSKGVVVRAGERVTEIHGDEQGNVIGVRTGSGDVIDAQLVLVAVGVRPNVKLAQEAGLQIGETRAIAVNEYLQTSDPDIYAGGDCVECTNLVTGKKAYLPMGSTANKHGRVIGDNVTGGKTRFKGVVGTAVLKVFDYNIGKVGLSEREAREEGFDVVTSLMSSSDCSFFYPTNKPISIKLVADRATGRLLGAQGFGRGELVKRLDVAATALTFGGDVEALANVDLGYAPPYSSAIDVIAHAANIIRNKIDGLATGISPLEAKAKVDRGDDFTWLDVRSEGEYRTVRIEHPNVKLIPLDELRNRLGELDRSKEIVVFCQISLRGYEAQRILDGAGFPDVKFVDGGLSWWPFDKATMKPAG